MLKLWLISLTQSVRFLNATAVCVCLLAIATILGSGVYFMQRLPMFNITSVEVMGLRGDKDLKHQNEAYFKRATLPLLKGSYFTTQLVDIQHAFVQAPWVRHATVHRVWPNRILVYIEEHQAAATMNDDLLVNDLGEVFIVQLDEPLKQLPKFEGTPSQSARMLGRYKELNQWLSVLNLSTEKLFLSDRNAWTVRLNNQLVIEMGRDELHPGPEERVMQWAKLWSTLSVKFGAAQRIDLRYPNGFAVQPSNS